MSINPSHLREILFDAPSYFLKLLNLFSNLLVVFLFDFPSEEGNLILDCSFSLANRGLYVIIQHLEKIDPECLNFSEYLMKF
jgi:hypothetical protein